MRYLITCILMIISSFVFSQNVNLDSIEVKKSKIEFNGIKYDGYLIELNAPPDIVEDAINRRFKLQGSKPKETKGFLVYRNVVMPRIDPVKQMDAFIKVERKSKKEKDKSIVYFIPTIAGEISGDKSKSDTAANITAIENGDAFLLGLVPGVAMGVHEKDFANQQMLVKKEEKTLANLKDDQSSLEQKLKKLQDDIQYNKKAQEKQTIEVDKAKTKLNELIAKKPIDPGQ